MGALGKAGDGPAAFQGMWPWFSLLPDSVLEGKAFGTPADEKTEIASTSLYKGARVQLVQTA